MSCLGFSENYFHNIVEKIDHRKGNKKNEHFLRFDNTRKFGVFCFLVTFVLRFSLLERQGNFTGGNAIMAYYNSSVDHKIFFPINKRKIFLNSPIVG